MNDVLELLRSRQGEKSDEEFANEMGIRGVTLWRYKNQTSAMSTNIRKKLIVFFASRDDPEMVGALLIYKTGLKPSSQQLVELGKMVLSYNGH